MVVNTANSKPIGTSRPCIKGRLHLDFHQSQFLTVNFNMEPTFSRAATAHLQHESDSNYSDVPHSGQMQEDESPSHSEEMVTDNRNDNEKESDVSPLPSTSCYIVSRCDIDDESDSDQETGPLQIVIPESDESGSPRAAGGIFPSYDIDDEIDSDPESGPLQIVVPESDESGPPGAACGEEIDSDQESSENGPAQIDFPSGLSSRIVNSDYDGDVQGARETMGDDSDTPR